MEMVKKFFSFNGPINWWFQNLNKELKSKWFHFRGSFSYKKFWLSYEVCSGKSLKLMYQHGECGDNSDSSMIVLGLLFFTAYIKFGLPESWYFQRKCIATWDNNREFYLTEGRHYGFYVYDWSFVWSFHAKVNESSASDPWWMRQYIHLDELVLGKNDSATDELCSIENVKFSLGGTIFNMDSIKWTQHRRFRRFIPYALYHKTSIRVEMRIDKPPMYSGKGENVWDCGDDGTYGVYMPWEYDRPTYLNRNECAKLAVNQYVERVFEHAKRYGGARGDRGISKDSEYQYLGREPLPASAAEVTEVTDNLIASEEPNVTTH